MDTIRLNNTLVSLTQARVMAILNVTPDSLYDGGQHNSLDAAVDRAGVLIEEGADILDVGGASSRPGAQEITVDEETDRVLPVVEVLAKAYPTMPLSVDTCRSRVAHHCIEAGAAMVNDITAGAGDAAMLRTVAEGGVAYAAMHMRGTPATMQESPRYTDVVAEILAALHDVDQRAAAAGIHDVVLDPGFGFGKSVAHNYTLLRRLSEFTVLGRPLLVGLSRKSMIYKVLDGSPATALNGTSALHMAALLNGARIIRVHDVAPAREVIELHEALKGTRLSTLAG